MLEKLKVSEINVVNPSIKEPVRSWFNVSLMSVGHFMSDFYTAFLPVLLPILAAHYDISYTQSATIYMIFTVAMNFAQPPIGILADRKNLNYLLPLSILTGALFASAATLSPNLWGIILIVLLCGICSSGFHPVSAAVLTKVIPENNKGLGTSIYIAGGNIGFAIAPLCVASFIESFGENYLLAMAIPAIITTVLIYKQRLQNAQTVAATPKDGPKFSTLITSKQFLVLNSAIALRSWTYCSFVVFLPMLFNAKGYDSISGASCLVVMLLGCVAGGLVGGALTDKFGPKKVTLGSFVVSLIGSITFLNYCDTSFISLLALFLCGAGAYGSTPNAIVWAQRLLPNSSAFAASMMLGFTFGAGYIESVLTGYLGDIIGLDKAMLYTACVAMAAAFFLLLPLKEPADTKNKTN